MANHNTDLATKYANKETMIPIELGGRLRVYKDSYVTASANSGDTITGAPLPQNARVVGGFIAQNGLGTSVTLALSIGGIAILAATSAATAGVISLPDSAGAVNLKDNPDLGGKSPVLAVGGANATDGKTIVLVIYYVVD